MHTTKKVKVNPSSELDAVALESGRLYSKVVSYARKIHRKKGIWLSEHAMQKCMRLRSSKLHSQTVQALVSSYYDALKSYFRVVKSNPDAKPPKRTTRYFKVRWKSSAIRHKDGMVYLSNGKRRAPITLKSDALPVYVELYFQRGIYYFSLVYKVSVPPKQETGKAVAIDMGEIHPIVSHDGEHTIIYNGREVRAMKQYMNKVKAHFQTKMDRCQQRSNRWYRLKRIKTKLLAKLAAQNQGCRA